MPEWEDRHGLFLRSGQKHETEEKFAENLREEKSDCGSADSDRSADGSIFGNSAVFSVSFPAGNED